MSNLPTPLDDLTNALNAGEVALSFFALEQLYHLAFERDAPRVDGEIGRRLRDAVFAGLRTTESVQGDQRVGIESNAWISLVRLGDRSDAVADRLIAQSGIAIEDQETARIVHAAVSYLGYFASRGDVAPALTRIAGTAAEPIIRDAAIFSLGVHGSSEARTFLESRQDTQAARVALAALGRVDFPTIESAGRFRHSLYGCDVCGHVWTDGPIWPNVPPARADSCERCGAPASGQPLWSADLDDRVTGSRRSEFSSDAWKSLAMLPLLFGQVTMGSDGDRRPEEMAFFEHLLGGQEAEALLAESVHAQLGSRPELAQEVLQFAIREELLAELRVTGDVGPGEQAPEYLEEWIAEGEDAASIEERGMLAKGLLLEALHVGVRMAAADGKVVDEERMVLADLVRRIDLDPEDVRVVWEAVADAGGRVVVGEPDRDRLRNLLGESLALRESSQLNGDPQAMAEAIVLARQAVDLSPDDPDWLGACLGNLAQTLREAFRLGGDQGLLEEGIDAARAASAATPPGHPNRVATLTTLSPALLDWYRVTGDADALREAVDLARQALEESTADGADAVTLNVLSAALQTLFAETGDRRVLAEAIEVARASIRTRSLGDPSLVSDQTNLAAALEDWYAITADPSVLEEAIGLGRHALARTPPDHPNRPGRLNTLGNALLSWFGETGDLSVLDEAISVRREALAIARPGNRDFPSITNNLANGLQVRYRMTGDRASLEEALRYRRQAVDATPPDSIDRVSHLKDLVTTLRDWVDLTGDPQAHEVIDAALAEIADLQH